MLATPVEAGSLYDSASKSASMNETMFNSGLNSGLNPGLNSGPASGPIQGLRSMAVMAAGVIAILGSVVTAIGILIAMMGLLISFGQPSPFEQMPEIRVMSIVFLVEGFAIAIWGAFSGVGLIRSKNWASISVLVWAGITAPVCAIVIVSM